MDIDEVFAGKTQGLTPSPAFEATIASDPGSVEDGVKVKIQAMSTTRSFGPLPWPSRTNDDGDSVLPSKGDRALVIFSNDHEAWVIAWWPYG